MKNILIVILTFLSIPSFSNQGGGDSGGGPRPEVGREVLQLHRDAQRIAFADMELASKLPVEDREFRCKRNSCTKSIEDIVKKVKVVVKYSMNETHCVENQKGRERCFDRFSVGYKSIYFDISSFSEDVIETLKKRRLFSSKKRFVKLAEENMTLDVVSSDEGQLVYLEVL